MQNQMQRRGVRGGLLAGLFLLVLGASSLALAQPPGGPPQGGGPGGPGGFGPPGGPGGRPGMFGQQMSVANVPVAALDAEFKLSDRQKQEIKQIQDTFHKEQRALMPGFLGGPNGGRPGGPPNGGPPNGGPPNGGPPGGGPPNGAPPNFEQMRANMEKMRTLDEKASKQIEALLTDSQKKMLPDALKELGDLGPTGIPLDILGDLKLTADQKTRIIAVSRKSQQDLRQKMDEARQSGDFQSIRDLLQTSRETTQKQIMAALSLDQRTMIENFIKEHPMRGPGGFGGPGGFPGGPGGFGPPGGGPPPPGRGPRPGGGPGDGPPPPEN
jgi:hypothetical protein